MYEKPFECSDIAHQSSISFAGFIQSRQYDSADQVLNYWEGKCGTREPIFRARVILAIAKGGDADSFVNEQNFDHFENYMHRAEMIQNRNYLPYDYSQPYFGYVPVGQEFDSFSTEFFKMKCAELKQDTNTVNYLLCRFYGYSTEHFYLSLQTGRYERSNISKEYYKLVNKYINRPEFHWSLLGGVWIPTGNITILGTHPRVGGQMGMRYKKLTTDLTVAFNFLRSKTPYNAKRVRSDQSVVVTDKYFGGYIGLDAGYCTWSKKKNELLVLSGIGLDGFDAIDADTINNLKAESTWTYNFNFGVGYRYYIGQSVYVGLRAKYNIVNYALTGAVDFTGNPFTVTLVVGGFSNDTKRYALKALDYDPHN